MKRILGLGVAFALLGMMAGCGSDSREGLITETINHIKLASTEIGNIKTRVKEATDKATKENKKLDLADAMEATKKLKETGEKTQDLKRRIDTVKATVSDEDRQSNAEKYRDDLNKAFASLLKQKEELREVLASAEKIDKTKVEDLRKKIVDAESPFEALSR